jgi:hypothetical protein
MSAVLTREMLATLDPKVLRLLAKDDAYKAIILDIQAEADKAKHAEAIAFANAFKNGENFSLNGESVPFWMVAFVAQSNLSITQKNAFNTEESFPLAAAIKDEAKSIIRLIEQGHKALGEEFQTYDKKLDAPRTPLRAIVEATL